jgi:polyribonucleotide nucleotidyltransferase
MNIHKEEFVWNGATLRAEFTDLAEQANATVMLSCNNTVVFATVCYSDSIPNPGYFNLTVEYLEKNYASGQILGSQWNKREGRPTLQAVLASRIIDRTIRPLFDQRMQQAIQVTATVIALGDFDPVVLAMNAVSIALHTSSVPWNGPVGAVRVSRATVESDIQINQYNHNPETEPDLDVLVCARDGAIVMIESDAQQVSEDIMARAFESATTHALDFEKWCNSLRDKYGKEKYSHEEVVIPAELFTLVTDFARTTISNAFAIKGSVKSAMRDAQDYAVRTTLEYCERETLDTIQSSKLRKAIHDTFDKICDELFAQQAQQGNRADGRAFDEIRPLYVQAGGIAPQLHGTGIFYRGKTHVMSVVTLAGPDGMQEVETIELTEKKRFMHHYNFPPYSVGEVGRFGSTGRRELGHGALAEKALARVLPDVSQFPYTIRVVSECFGSDGSTSQASICAGSIALLDAGVPITDIVAGISIGAFGDSDNPILVTDIMGIEDHHGLMDYKIAGSRKGITAIQLDIKAQGIPVSALIAGLHRAKIARETIITEIEQVIPEPRAELNEYAPRIKLVMVPTEKIGMVIGGGGKTIQKIQADTGTTVSIEDDGSCYITGSRSGVESARETIMQLIKVWAVGEQVEGTVVKVLDIGALVELSPIHDGLVHISECAPWRVENMNDIIQVGQKVPVEVIAVDPEKNRISLSIKKRDSQFFDAKKPRT